jgi:hypothetical protein
MNNKLNLTVQLKDLDSFVLSIYENDNKIGHLEKNIKEMIDFVNYLNTNINFSLFWSYEFKFWETDVLDKNSSYYFSYDGYNSITLSFYGYFDEVKVFDENDGVKTYIGHKDIVKYLSLDKDISIDYCSEGIEFSSKSKVKLFKYIKEQVYNKYIKPKHDEIRKIKFE